MCWSGQASATLAILGFTGAYLEYRKMHRYGQQWNDKYGLRAVANFYFSLMETLQAANYTVLDAPGFLNSFYSFLGYLHVCFQPLFISFMTLSLIPKQRCDYWMKYVLFFSTISAVCLLSRLIINPSLPGCFSCHCSPVPSMDSLLYLSTHFSKTIGCTHTSFLSYHGDWHIAWKWLLNNCSVAVYSYIFTVFMLPFLYGTYLTVITYTLCGPIASIYLSTNPDEFGAVWCLIAIVLVSTIKIPAWERILTVRYEAWNETVKHTLLWMNQLQKNFGRNLGFYRIR